jgi:hypothetical protein
VEGLEGLFGQNWSKVQWITRRDTVLEGLESFQVLKKVHEDKEQHGNEDDVQNWVYQ